MCTSKISGSVGGRIAGCHSSKVSRMLWLASLSVAATPLFIGTSLRAANTPVDVPTGTTDLTTLGTTASSDLTFTNTTYVPNTALFTIDSSIISGTLDDLDSTDGGANPITISNTSGVGDTLTLSNASGNSVSPSSADLIYVVSGASLSINGGVAGTGTITNTINFGAAGNLDIAGSATITSPLSGSGLITVTGGGTLNLGPSSAAAIGNNGLTGGFAIQSGNVVLGGATNEPEWDLGPQTTGQVTLGGGSAGTNATLTVATPTANMLYNMTVAATGNSSILNSTSGTVTFLTGSFTLNNNLTVADTSTGTLGFRNTIAQSGGTWGITVGNNNTGTVNFQGASTYTGGVTIDAGVVTVGTTEGSANPSSGPFGGGTLTIGGNPASSATLTDAANVNVGNPIVIGAANTAITRTIIGDYTGSGSPIVDVGETMTLNSNLNVEEDVAANTFGFRNTIVQGGATNYGITVDSNNAGTVDFRGANTFAGGVTIDSGTVTFNASSTAAPVTSGPFGTGTVTLGGVSTLSAALGSGSSFTIANPIVVGAANSGITRTITETSASSSAGTIAGPITLNNDLTLTAAATTLVTGADRLRLGSGGITGSNNIIINNLNNTSISPTAKGPIRLDGTGVVTSTWTGNLIVEAGLGSLGTGATIDATSANNTVLVASGASFDFASNEGTSSGFSPTIAGLDNYMGSGGYVFESAPSNQTLNLGGNGNYAFSGTINDSTNTGNTTALNVNLSGAGTQTLSGGANTYSGGTTLTGGVLNFSALGDLGSGSITFNGGTLQYAAGNITDISTRTVTLSTNGGTIDTHGNTVTFANSIGNGGAGSLTKIGSGTLTLSGVNNYTGGTNANGGILVIAPTSTPNAVALPNGPVTIGAAGTLQLADNASASTPFVSSATDISNGLMQMSSLSIASGGVLDVRNNHFYVADPGGVAHDATYTSILGYVANGVNHPANGEITSTEGLSGYGVGIVDGNDGVLGTGVSANQIEVAYTLEGDANLDGKVDITDFNIFAPAFGLPTTLGWEAGDFNYSGTVDIGDFNLFAGNFGLSDNGTAISMPAADYAALDSFAAANGLTLPTSSVPEPASLTLLALGAVGILARRRRKECGA